MKNYGASVRAKLLILSKEKRVELTGLLIRYATDRLLYRLSKSKYSSDFILKGSLLFSVWNKDMHRPTKDADLLGFGKNDEDYILSVFRVVCSTEAPEDGLAFDLDTLRVEQIREDEEYEGKRIKISATLDGANIPIQVDIGFGDVVTPEAKSVYVTSNVTSLRLNNLSLPSAHLTFS